MVETAHSPQVDAPDRRAPNDPNSCRECQQESGQVLDDEAHDGRTGEREGTDCGKGRADKCLLYALASKLKDEARGGRNAVSGTWWEKGGGRGKRARGFGGGGEGARLSSVCYWRQKTPTGSP